MVAHVWAQQNQPEGRSANGQFFFEGATIYSYNTRRPLGHFAGEFVFLNVESYSVTTSKHLGYVRSALPAGKPIIGINNKNVVLSAINYSKYKERGQADLDKNAIHYIINTVDYALTTASKRRKASLIEGDLNVAHGAITSMRALYNALELPLPQEIDDNSAKLEGDIETLLANRKKD